MKRNAREHRSKQRPQRSTLRAVLISVGLVAGVIAVIFGWNHWQDRPCHNGDGKVCFDRAQLAAGGSRPDKQRAVKLYRLSCDAGHARGCTAMGNAHRNGFGVPSDMKVAREYYDRGCKGGDPQGCAFGGTGGVLSP